MMREMAQEELHDPLEQMKAALDAGNAVKPKPTKCATRENSRMVLGELSPIKQG